MRRSLMTLLVLGSCFAASWSQAATSPKQPEQGPGGTDYVGEGVTKRGIGTASAGAYVFHANTPPTEPRPVVVILHSWGGTNPGLYGGWIEHLARKGNLVIFPRFQEVNRTKPADATKLAASILANTLESLAQDANARPDLDRVAYIGHLAGVPVALNLATGAGQEGLPQPKLILALMPGGIASGEKSRGIPLDDLAAIDASTLLITMSGDRDYLPADRTAKRILKETVQIPASRKLFMRVGSDDHGYPALTATLVSPGSPKPGYDAADIKLPPDPPKDPKQKSPWKWSADMSLTGEQTLLTVQIGNNATDTLDYLAFWKTFDLAAEAAFTGKDAAALRKDARLTDMGTWTDGWPVRRLSAEVPKDPASAEDQPAKGPRRRLN
ncbi:chlorophyllase/cutinase-like alpha/beta fold protein [Microvirga flavescens]|uniref:poly(ethylene terephthalate) hydrolase family protein n=1 Tax=Microvirga flavescens TaxID=2249811 RepID=UPI000DD85DD2|nr:alpha/beta hydrolase [Microvirga flavescens]